MRALLLPLLAVLLVPTADAVPDLAVRAPDGPAETQLCHKGEKDDVCAIIASYDAYLGALARYLFATACAFDAVGVCDVA